MRFLVDECMPRELVDRLAGLGHDVVFVPDVARSEADRRLAERATDQGRIIITRDYDFGHLAEAGLMPAGLLLVAPMPDRSTSGAVQRVVDVVFEEAAALAGRLTLIEARRIRVRASPNSH